MKLQIIESISKHAVTLVLVIGILMLTDKGIMPTGIIACLLYTSPSPRDRSLSRMPSSA